MLNCLPTDPELPRSALFICLGWNSGKPLLVFVHPYSEFGILT